MRGISITRCSAAFVANVGLRAAGELTIEFGGEDYIAGQPNLRASSNEGDVYLKPLMVQTDG